MIIRTLRDSESLDSIAEDLLFTESRLKSDENAKELAPVMTALMTSVDQVRAGQVAASRDEVTAHAQVAAADYQLDDWIKTFDRELLDVLRGNTKSPRYERYFNAAPWTFIRLGLESEISRVRGWVDSLASEPEQSLKDMGAALAKLIAQGEAALDQRRKAVSARSDHRVRSIASLIEEINTVRAALYGDLAKKAAEANLPIDWPSRFFRRGSHRKGEEPTPPAPEGGPTPKTSGK
jgi:hypothetical protein